MFKFYLHLFLIISTCFSLGTCLYPQYVQFYTEVDDACFGAYDYTYESVNYTAGPQHVGSLRMVGMWSVTFENKVDGFKVKWTCIQSGTTCILRRSNYTVLSATKHIQSDLEESELLLFTEEFTGEFISIKSNESSFPQPKNFSSYVFTGIVPYTIFEGTGFNGSQTCLRVDEGNDLEFGYTFDYGRNFTVGSVRLGCNTDQDLIASKQQHYGESDDVYLDDDSFQTKARMNQILDHEISILSTRKKAREGVHCRIDNA